MGHPIENPRLPAFDSMTTPADWSGSSSQGMASPLPMGVASSPPTGVASSLLTGAILRASTFAYDHPVAVLLTVWAAWEFFSLRRRVNALRRRNDALRRQNVSLSRHMQLVKILEDEQGEWFVGYILAREVNRLFAHYAEAGDELQATKNTQRGSDDSEEEDEEDNEGDGDEDDDEDEDSEGDEDDEDDDEEDDDEEEDEDEEDEEDEEDNNETIELDPTQHQAQNPAE